MTAMPDCPVVHLELHTGDLAAARTLYGELCGWRAGEIRTASGTYLAMGLGGVGGGMVACGTRRALWLPYVEVADISEAMGRARRLGATERLGAREGPAGWRGVVSTPAGGEIAFWQPKDSA
jgi:predicted enzyme related to lactoylglutathione lyase